MAKRRKRRTADMIERVTKRIDANTVTRSRRMKRGKGELREGSRSGRRSKRHGKAKRN